MSREEALLVRQTAEAFAQIKECFAEYTKHLESFIGTTFGGQVTENGRDFVDLLYAGERLRLRLRLAIREDQPIGAIQLQHLIPAAGECEKAAVAGEIYIDRHGDITCTSGGEPEFDAYARIGVANSFGLLMAGWLRGSPALAPIN